MAGEASFPKFSDNLLAIVRPPGNLISVHNVTANGISTSIHNFTTNVEVRSEYSWDITADAVVVADVELYSRKDSTVIVFPMKNGVEEQTLRQSWQGAGLSSAYRFNVIMMDKVRNFACEFSSRLSNKRRGGSKCFKINGRGRKIQNRKHGCC